MCRRYIDTQTKIEALQLIASIVRGLGDRDRNVVSIQADALKAAVRSAKEAANSETCLAAAGETSAELPRPAKKRGAGPKPKFKSSYLHFDWFRLTALLQFAATDASCSSI